MDDYSTVDFMDLIDTLRKGKMLDHPAVSFLVNRGITTGDYSKLEHFLKHHPAIISTAKQNIAIEESQQKIDPFSPYPTRGEAAEKLNGPLKLGIINEFGSWFGIPWDVLCMPVIDIGRVGSGKSVLIKNLIRQTIDSPQHFNILVTDLKKEYRHLHPYGQRLKILTKDKVVINPLQVPQWSHPLDHTMAFAKTFISENYLVGTSENLLIDLVNELYRKRGIIDGSANYPTLTDLYQLISKQLFKTKSFKFTDQMIWLQNRLRPYILCENFNYRFGIPFEIFRKENLVIEMDTGFTDRMYNFTVASIVHQLYLYNKVMNLRGSTLRHLIMVDEGRILFNANRDASIFGESILNEDITKSRDFGISFFVASQESGSFNQIIRSLAYLKIGFPLNDAADLKFIQESFGLNDEQTQHLFKLPPYGVAVVRYGGFEKPFLMEVPKFETNTYLNDDEIKEKMAPFYRKLARYIKKPDLPSPATIKNAGIKEEMPAGSEAMLYFLGKNPFLKLTELQKHPDFKSPAGVNKNLDWLESNGFLKREKYRTSSTRKATYMVLQPKAFNYLGIKKMPGVGSFEHQLFQHIIKKRLKDSGLTAQLEGRMKKSKKAIDVLSKSPDGGYVAYEVTLNTVNLLKNVKDNFKAGVLKVVIVCRSKSELGQAEQIVKGSNLSKKLRKNVSFKTIDYFSS